MYRAPGTCGNAVSVDQVGVKTYKMSDQKMTFEKCIHNI